jgi:hypothetical protein
MRSGEPFVKKARHAGLGISAQRARTRGALGSDKEPIAHLIAPLGRIGALRCHPSDRKRRSIMPRARETPNRSERLALVGLIALFLLIAPAAAPGQQPQEETERKIVLPGRLFIMSNSSDDPLMGLIAVDPNMATWSKITTERDPFA